MTIATRGRKWYKKTPVLEDRVMLTFYHFYAGWCRVTEIILSIPTSSSQRGNKAFDTVDSAPTVTGAQLVHKTVRLPFPPEALLTPRE